MKRSSQIILIIASLSMIISLFLPLWDIQLSAPQYPEGLDMKIWLNKFSGDVNTISGLNHYIGMRKIEESMFPELQFMKPAIIFFIISGVLVALMRKKWIYASWFVLFFIFAMVGFYDFWQWEYDYGHNLDPHAAIKIPGMSYQPPFLGCKQLLNFNACSFPDQGGQIIMIAGTVCFIIFIYEMFFSRKKILSAQIARIKKLKFAAIY